jgi:negative regulator of sigma-B (phosphoserine phosphatase)
MTTSAHRPTPLIEWHVAGLQAKGQSVSGDAFIVQSFKDGMLLAVVDGVGHGREATAAARVAIKILKQRTQDSVIALVQRCHKALLNTRGVVMTVAILCPAESTLTWIGVGNVAGRLLRADAGWNHAAESVMLCAGMVGHRLPRLHASVLTISRGDLLILATDGVYAGFDTAVNPAETPSTIAEHILKEYYKGYDDALVLAVRYLGTRPSPRNARSGFKPTEPQSKPNPAPTPNSYGQNPRSTG